MRNKSCPIVTFQTERKGNWFPQLPVALEPVWLRAPAFRRSFPRGRLSGTRRAADGKRRVNNRRVGADLKGDSGRVDRQLSTAWAQTAAFLQQVPKTIEVSRHRPGSTQSFSLPN